MDKQTVCWKGEDQKQWYANVGIDGGAPCIFELGYELAGERLALAKMLHPQFKAVTAKRTKINPQREKALAPGEELDYQWDKMCIRDRRTARAIQRRQLFGGTSSETR